jgi:hypothetical protein
MDLRVDGGDSAIDDFTGQRIGRNAHGKSQLDLGDLTLRQRKIDENRIQGLERNDGFAPLEVLSQVDQAEAQAPGKRARGWFFWQ